MRRRPLIVQHSFGSIGSGGPIGALERVLASDFLRERYDFVRMHQEHAAGGVDLRRLRDWAAMLRKLSPDIVHVRGLGNEGFHGALAARLAGCPRLLVSVHGTVRDLTSSPSIRSRVLVGMLEPATLHLATHVTTVCEFAQMRDFVQRHKEKLVGPLVNGVDVVPVSAPHRVRLREELGAGVADVVLISVGRLTFEKGHHDLAKALSSLPPGVRERLLLVVVGEGPDRAEICAGYKAVDMRVRMMGRRLDVPQLLAAADIFVFPSLHENLSNALLEAMAQGIPVVASRVGGNVEVVGRGGGRLIEPNRPEHLADVIQELADSRALREYLGAEAAATALEHYSMRSMVESLDRAYSQILKEVQS